MSDAIDDRIRANRLRFDTLVRDAERRIARGDAGSAAVVAQVAAALGWHSPTGLFASPRLEALLRTIGEGTPITSRRQAVASGPERVVHVLTTAYAVGGHTRLVWRWIELDDERRHSVVLTRQGQTPIPSDLTLAAQARGGPVIRLDRGGSSLLRSAERLSRVLIEADVVVLHLHPFDVVPALALAAMEASGRRPPTILLNHADHVFWVGGARSDLVLHLRASGAAHAAARRGIAPARSGILPIPLGAVGHVVDRASARRALGFSPSDVVAISVATGYKFGAPDGPRRLLPLIERAVTEMPNLRVLTVGPGNATDWVSAERRTGGRIRSSGTVSDLGPIYAAADIYLDPYPFSSLTSMLEAGRSGLPLLALGDPDPELDVLAFDDPATDDLGVLFRSVETYLAALRQLVEDPGARERRGQAIKDALDIHGGAPWRAQLHHAYAEVRRLHRAGQPHADADDPGLTVMELDRRLVVLLDAQQGDAPAGVRGHLRFAPFPMRLEEWRRSRRTARPLSIAVLLPEPALMAARRVGILARRGIERARTARRRISRAGVDES